MRLKDGWTLAELGGSYVAVPTEESAEDFCGIVRLNESGRAIWGGLAEGLTEEEITDRLMKEYTDLDQSRAQNAVKKVINQLIKEGLLTE